MIIIKPIIEYILNFSFNITLVHTSEINGVIYAILDILDVSPFSNASAHDVKAIADVNIPIHNKPKS